MIASATECMFLYHMWETAKKPLEALGNSTDFMLLALADRHLPQPAGCGNYNLLPSPYLFLYLYRLYMPLPVPCSISDFCVSFQIPQPIFFDFPGFQEPGLSSSKDRKRI